MAKLPATFKVHVTDGKVIDLLSRSRGYHLCDWRPQRPEIVLNQSVNWFTGLEYPAHYTVKPTTESLTLKLNHWDTDRLIVEGQELNTAALRAIRFWANDPAVSIPVYSEVKAKNESNTRYAIWLSAQFHDDSNPFAQPFTNPDIPLSDELVFPWVHGPWLSLPPGMTGQGSFYSQYHTIFTSKALSYRLNGWLKTTTEFSHEADASIDYGIRSLPDSGSINLNFRMQDQDNYWQVLIDPDGDIRLYLVIGGAPAIRGNTDTVVNDDSAIRIEFYDTFINIYVDDVLHIQEVGATNFVNETGGNISVGDGGATTAVTITPYIFVEQYSGNVAESTVFAHPADGIIEYTLGGLPDSGINRFHFRANGTGDWWQYRISSDGSGILYLFMGATINKGSHGPVLTGGERIRILLEDQLIAVYADGVELIRQEEAVELVDETIGVVHTIEAGSSVSDLVTVQLSDAYREANQPFTHSANFEMNYTIKKLPDNGTIETSFRIHDGKNYYVLGINHLGDWVFVRVKGNTPVVEELFSGAAEFNDGDTVTIRCNYQEIAIYNNDVLVTARHDAYLLQTATGGSVDTVGDGGEISDIYIASIINVHYEPGLVPTGTTFDHNENGYIRYRVILPTGSSQTRLYFRRPDGDNHWSVWVNELGTITLYEYINGGPIINRARVNGLVQDNDVIGISMEGETIRVYCNSEEIIEYDQAVNFVSETFARLDYTDPDAEVHDLLSQYNSLTEEFYGSPLSGERFTHDPDCTIEFDLVQLSTLDPIEINFRSKNDSNTWGIKIAGTGNIDLYELVNNDLSWRGGHYVTAGQHVSIIMNGPIIQVLIDDVQKIVYSEADRFTDMGNGQIVTTGNNGIIANVEVYTFEALIAGVGPGNTDPIYIANHITYSVIDTVYHGAQASNLQSGPFPPGFTIFTDETFYTYFGAVEIGEPFFNLIFRLTSGTAINDIVKWQFWHTGPDYWKDFEAYTDGGEIGDSFIIDTQTFAWGRLDGWSPTTVNGSLGFWVRAYIDDLVVPVDLPVQSDGPVVNHAWNWFDYYNQSPGDDGVYLDLGIGTPFTRVTEGDNTGDLIGESNQIILGSRSHSRGINNFTPIINATINSDDYAQFGLSMDYGDGTLITYNDPFASSHNYYTSIVRHDIGSGEGGERLLMASVEIDPSAAANYYGKYRLFARASTTATRIDTGRIYIHAEVLQLPGGASPTHFQQKSKKISDYLVNDMVTSFDLGSVYLGSKNNVGQVIYLYYSLEEQIAGEYLDFLDIVLIPEDEWFCHVDLGPYPLESTEVLGLNTASSYGVMEARVYDKETGYDTRIPVVIPGSPLSFRDSVDIRFYVYGFNKTRKGQAIGAEKPVNWSDQFAHFRIDYINEVSKYLSARGSK